jgi:hypothetical protein
MKLIVLIFTMCFGLASAQNYTVGTPVLDTLCQFTYYSPGHCISNNVPLNFDFGIDTDNLDNLFDVSGVNLELHVLEVNVPGGNVVDTVTGQEMFPGLVLPFEDTSYILVFSTIGSIKYALIASGTPTQYCESYPCNEFYSIVTLGECWNGAIIDHYPQSGFCNVLQYPETTIEVTECESYLWNSNNETYTLSDIYTDTLQTVEGCDSIVHLDLTIYTINSSISTTIVDGDIVLKADEAGLQYQWVDCLDEHSFILNETSQSFTPIVSGSYAVQISDNGCVFESDCEVVDIASVGMNELNNISIFPNPNNGSFTLFTNSNLPLNVRIIDALGKIVFQKFDLVQEATIELEAKTGVYFVLIQQNDVIIRQKLVVR